LKKGHLVPMKHSYDKNTCLLEEQSQFFVKFNTIKRYRN